MVGSAPFSQDGEGATKENGIPDRYELAVACAYGGVVAPVEGQIFENDVRSAIDNDAISRSLEWRN
jgi:hypothetical protein